MSVLLGSILTEAPGSTASPARIVALASNTSAPGPACRKKPPPDADPASETGTGSDAGSAALAAPQATVRRLASTKVEARRTRRTLTGAFGLWLGFTSKGLP